MGKMTKNEMIDKFLEVAEEYGEINSELFDLVQQDKIKYGEYLVHGLYNNFSYLTIMGGTSISGNEYPTRLYGWRVHHTTSWEYRHNLKCLMSSLEDAKKLIAQVQA